jgi:DNA-binding MarR family transcriptional regulator
MVNSCRMQCLDPNTSHELSLKAVEVLGRLAALFDERRRQLAESAGLTVVQWQALEEVQHEHFMPSMFATQRASSAAAVSKVLRQLADKGLIVASLSSKDGRQREYKVTKQGRDVLDHVRAQRQRAIAEVWLKLSDDELRQFISVGGHVANRLDEWATQAAREKKKESDENG